MSLGELGLVRRRKSSHHGNFYAITKLFSEHRTMKQETLGAIQEPSPDRAGSVRIKVPLHEVMVYPGEQ